MASKHYFTFGIDGALLKSALAVAAAVDSGSVRCLLKSYVRWFQGTANMNRPGGAPPRCWTTDYRWEARVADRGALHERRRVR